MNRWSVGLLRIFFAFVIVFVAQVASISISAVFHSHSSFLFGITFLFAAICVFLFLERAFPAVYSSLREPKPWWRTRAAEVPAAIAFALIISVLSSRIATLWFGLLIISGVLVALFLRVTRRESESPDLLTRARSRVTNHFQVADHIRPQSDLKLSRNKQIDETLRPKQSWRKPPFSIPDNCAIDVHNLSGIREWYKEKLGLREANADRQDDSGRPFVDLHISNDETFLSLVEVPSGASAENRHVVFFAKNLDKAHQWLAARGVLVEPITSDSGRNRLFRFHDLEGNTIEVCVEPQ